MNYTTNYHLPQWVESDRILMEDFNAAMSSIDGGIKGAQNAAAEAQGAAEIAQSTAEAAQSSADAAQSTADNAYCPENKPYVVGSYTGTGEQLTITLGFRPKFVVISGMKAGAGVNSTIEWDRNFGLCDGTVLSERLAFTDTGFIVRPQGFPYSYYPDFSESGRTYCYIAFR